MCINIHMYKTNVKSIAKIENTDLKTQYTRICIYIYIYIYIHIYVHIQKCIYTHKSIYIYMTIYYISFAHNSKFSCQM